MAAQPEGAAPLRMGSAWYPEQWPESRWEADLALMEQAHLNVVRVGEFAWSTMEPSEGKFDFGWLDRAVALAAKHHIVVIMGTPSAAPPAWMTSKYPDTLRVEGKRSARRARQPRAVFQQQPTLQNVCDPYRPRDGGALRTQSERGGLAD